LTSNIGAYDALDGVTNWTSQDLKRLVNMLLDDALVFDVAEDCDVSGPQYLTLERSLLRGETPVHCGGRLITDDIMKTMYSLYINGLNENFLDYETGVSVPYQSSFRKVKESFPHLAFPESTGFFVINIKRYFLNNNLKKAQE